MNQKMREDLEELVDQLDTIDEEVIEDDKPPPGGGKRQLLPIELL